MLEEIIIFGAGGHAKVVIDAIEMAGRHKIMYLVDANPALLGTYLKRYLVRNEQDGFSAVTNDVQYAFVAIGNNKIRRDITTVIKQRGFQLATVVHPAAVKANDALVGEGTLVMPGSVINSSAVIGANVIINTGAIVEHDCRIGSYTHIAPRATLCGGVEISDCALIGAGAIVLPRLKVGANAIVGAGAVVVSDVPDGAIVKGAPARI